MAGHANSLTCSQSQRTSSRRLQHSHSEIGDVFLEGCKTDFSVKEALCVCVFFVLTKAALIQEAKH